VTPARLAEIERMGAEHGRRQRLEQGLPAHAENPTLCGELARLLLQAEDRRAPEARSA
jgi:hypothetical protein